MTNKHKSWTAGITFGITLLGFLGITQLPIPSLAFADEVEQIQQTLEAQIETLKGKDEQLKLVDLETQREQKQLYQEQYEQQLSEAEDESYALEVQQAPQPPQIKRRIERYQRFLDNNEKQMLILNQKILNQQQRVDAAFQ